MFDVSPVPGQRGGVLHQFTPRLVDLSLLEVELSLEGLDLNQEHHRTHSGSEPRTSQNTLRV